MQGTRVAVVGGPELVREGIVALLSTQYGITLTHPSEAGVEEHESIGHQPPQVVVLISDPAASPPGALDPRAMRQRWPSARILALSPWRVHKPRDSEVAVGMTAHLTARATLDDLLRAVNPDAPPRSESSRDSASEHLPLTARERDVFKLLALGYSNRTIGGHLNLAEGTVKHHTHRIYRKLGVGSRVEAVRIALLFEKNSH
ncbi:response regulator transcription factor [Herbiconiux moechotypicola]|uniref:Response regulator transcription factor n=1 Tax=Herbiconiux moechotypicola TaxID=637393 RepID=A0ABN3DH99_9MICO|nr:response regulator transcription factor [Herbiconiux moechotypicola]MCS5729577.1 response regulator transcription factor [Herbiconiux moechotypicola]